MTQAKKEKKRASSHWNYPYFIPHQPFSIASKVKKAESKQYLKFLELIKNIHAKVFLANLIACVPKQYKLVKEITTKKVKVSEEEVIPLSDKCCCIIQKDLVIPSKVQGLGSCTFPCDVRKMHFEKTLCDIGSGVSIMPLSIAEKIGIVKKMTLSHFTLQLAERCLFELTELVEDVLIKLISSYY